MTDMGIFTRARTGTPLRRTNDLDELTIGP